MSNHPLVLVVLLAVAATACWVGVLGMWRMREPTQALHYLSLPAAIGSVALTVAVFLQTGFGQATAKCIAITFVLLGINSVVTHASARAFRVRKLGHWEPREEDDLEEVSEERAA